MKRFITNILICLALCVITPGAFADKKEKKAKKIKESNPEVIEPAAQSISAVIAVDAKGNNDRFLKYARRLALTLDQKSSAELNRILQSGNHFGLGE